MRDFYRIDGPDPLAVENGLERVETLAAPIIRSMEENQDLPSGANYDILMNLLASLAARAPRRRRALADLCHRVAEAIVELHTGTPERFERVKERLRAKGEPVPDRSFESMRRVVKERSLRYEMNRGWLVASMWREAELLVDLLADRKWTLVIAGRDAARFVCSDHPISLEPTRPGLFPFNSPGWGMKETVVYVPLSSRMALMGSFERGSDPVIVDSGFVAKVNHFTVIGADRHVYSEGEDFTWFFDRRMRHASDLHILLRRELG